MFIQPYSMVTDLLTAEHDINDLEKRTMRGVGVSLGKCRLVESLADVGILKANIIVQQGGQRAVCAKR
jgi:hypothetical protein